MPAAFSLIQLQDVLITAPARLRELITWKTVRGKVAQCAGLRPDTTQLSEPLHAAKTAPRALSRRIKFLDDEIAEIDHQLDPLVAQMAPTLASSGNTHRMRLHRGGDRQANCAVHMIAVCRLRYDQLTIDYPNHRRAEGLSNKDVLRCLKRFIAREVFRDLRADLPSN